MILDSTTRKLQVILDEAHTTNALPVVASWFDSGATPNGGPSLSNTNGTSAVDIVAAPAASYIRQVNEITVFNADTVTHGVSILYNDNGTTYVMMKVSLLTGEKLTYSKSLGWNCFDATGALKQSLGGTTANISDYSAGTWTPADASGAGLSFSSVTARYIKIGKYVKATVSFTMPSTANSSQVSISGLPFVSGALSSSRVPSPIFSNGTVPSALIIIDANSSVAKVFTPTSGAFHATANSDLSSAIVFAGIDYFTD